jgi:transposase-like protein
LERQESVLSRYEQIYTAPNKQAAEDALKDFGEKWESKYSYAPSPNFSTYTL